MKKRHISDDAPARIGARIVAKGMFRGELPSVTGKRLSLTAIEKLALREEYFLDVIIISI
jgi:hypothetical protein